MLELSHYGSTDVRVYIGGNPACLPSLRRLDVLAYNNMGSGSVRLSVSKIAKIANYPSDVMRPNFTVEFGDVFWEKVTRESKDKS